MDTVVDLEKNRGRVSRPTLRYRYVVAMERENSAGMLLVDLQRFLRGSVLYQIEKFQPLRVFGHRVIASYW